jgi:hypothetical protein
MANTIGGQPCLQDHRLCGKCGIDKDDHHPEDKHKFIPGLCPACTHLRSKHYYDWRDKQVLGSHVHHLAASWAKGEDIQSDPTIDPYLDGLEAWYDTYHPDWVALEQTIHYKNSQHEYVGTFDALATLDCACPLASDQCRCSYLLDIKTGTHKGDKEWMLQLSAYRYAKHLTTWEGRVQRLGDKMPIVGHTAVVWLHDDGTAELVPVETNAEVHNQFLRLLDFYNWDRRVTKDLKELAHADV